MEAWGTAEEEPALAKPHQPSSPHVGLAWSHHVWSEVNPAIHQVGELGQVTPLSYASVSPPVKGESHEASTSAAAGRLNK